MSFEEWFNRVYRREGDTYDDVVERIADLFSWHEHAECLDTEYESVIIEE